ncbi:hypothetical protein BKA82DRAFT_28989 [Pisolithus tinctorius]|uniref:Uncharacterized protein n=1 Tax=Pisolithus tinctorius Marx 270 TaxID=870435 RepID=A0A0C3P0W8_PISTI|nr:hypothetical protein BKA82DRAFT_28989 [Pisolithus tinctorius]KIO00994.1 hypothetical protein M404DRAFT_28989 [Pisolithus tinctorius Marx 270]
MASGTFSGSMMIGVMKDTELLESWVIISIIIISMKHKLRSSERCVYSLRQQDKLPTVPVGSAPSERKEWDGLCNPTNFVVGLQLGCKLKDSLRFVQQTSKTYRTQNTSASACGNNVYTFMFEDDDRHPTAELKRVQIVEEDTADGCIHVDKIKVPNEIAERLRVDHGRQHLDRKFRQGGGRSELVIVCCRSAEHCVFSFLNDGRL